jgi:hypothetical protein
MDLKISFSCSVIATLLVLIPFILGCNPQKNKKNFLKAGYFLLLCVLNLNFKLFNFQKPKRMKKVFAILAIVALASCGGSQETPAADTTAVAADTTAVVDSAATVDTTAAADTTKH